MTTQEWDTGLGVGLMDTLAGNLLHVPAKRDLKLTNGVA
jgi:hypothetical protein